MASALSDTHDLSNSTPQCNNHQVSTPLNILCSRAKANGFTSHDVPGDGNCLFSAISHQLPCIGMQAIASPTLRCMLVEHFVKSPIVNNVHYCNYLSGNVEIQDDVDAQLRWDAF